MKKGDLCAGFVWLVWWQPETLTHPERERNSHTGAAASCTGAFWMGSDRDDSATHRGCRRGHAQHQEAVVENVAVAVGALLPGVRVRVGLLLLLGQQQLRLLGLFFAHQRQLPHGLGPDQHGSSRAAVLLLLLALLLLLLCQYDVHAPGRGDGLVGAGAAGGAEEAAAAALASGLLAQLLLLLLLLRLRLLLLGVQLRVPNG